MCPLKEPLKRWNIRTVNYYILGLKSPTSFFCQGLIKSDFSLYLLQHCTKYSVVVKMCPDNHYKRMLYGENPIFRLGDCSHLCSSLCSLYCKRDVQTLYCIKSLFVVFMYSHDPDLED